MDSFSAEGRSSDLTEQFKCYELSLDLFWSQRLKNGFEEAFSLPKPIQRNGFSDKKYSEQWKRSDFYRVRPEKLANHMLCSRVRVFIPGYQIAQNTGNKQENHAIGLTKRYQSSRPVYQLDVHYPNLSDWHTKDTRFIAEFVPHSDKLTLAFELPLGQFSLFQDEVVQNLNEVEAELQFIDHWLHEVITARIGINKYKEIKNGNHMRGARFMLELLAKDQPVLKPIRVIK